MTDVCNPMAQVRGPNGDLFEIDLGELGNWQALEDFGFRLDELEKFGQFEDLWADFTGDFEAFKDAAASLGLDTDFLDGFTDGDQFDAGLSASQDGIITGFRITNLNQYGRRLLKPGELGSKLGSEIDDGNSYYDPENPDEELEPEEPEPDQLEELWIEDNSARITSTVEIDGIEIERIDQMVMVKRHNGHRIRWVFKHPAG